MTRATRRITGRTETARPIWNATGTTPSWWEVAKDNATNLEDTRGHIARAVAHWDGLHSDAEDIERALCPLVDTEGEIADTLSAETRAAIRRALEIANAIQRRAEDGRSASVSARTSADEIDWSAPLAAAEESAKHEERADGLEAEAEDLRGELAEALTPDDVGELLVDAGCHEPANGWTHAHVAELLQELAWLAARRRSAVG